MKPLSAIRVALLALTAFASFTLSAARADEGTVTLVIYKGGWIIGASGGGGSLNFHGRSYPLSAVASSRMPAKEAPANGQFLVLTVELTVDGAPWIGAAPLIVGQDAL